MFRIKRLGKITYTCGSSKITKLRLYLSSIFPNTCGYNNSSLKNQIKNNNRKLHHTHYKPDDMLGMLIVARGSVCPKRKS